MSLRIAFVGTGRMARLHLHALKRVATPHAVVGVYDASTEAAAAFGAAAGAPHVATLGALLDRTPDVVHVCTPAGTHFEPARAALEAGAHVYVEKPFVERRHEATELLLLAQRRGRLVCAGHQQVRDRSFTDLLRGATALAPVAEVDSDFAFQPVGLPRQASAAAQAAQLLDVLPHPLYTLLAALEHLGERGAPIELAGLDATPFTVHALFRCGEARGRLAVSLTARPVASTLAVRGAGGALTADFVRGMVIGASNPGTEALEKVASPMLEGAQLVARTAAAVWRRLRNGGDYPGLAELLGEFYAAVAAGGRSPLSPAHLLRVTEVYEELAANVHHAAAQRRLAAEAQPPAAAPAARTAVLTGARGFLGGFVARDLAARGWAVRGVSRSAPDADPAVHSWVRLDLSRPLPAKTLAGAEVVVHAAAATTGGFDAHEANSVQATVNLLRAMHAAGVHRMVYVSSISVLRPPRTAWEVQSERTPLADARTARRLGAYAWGKTEAERRLLEIAEALEIEVRIVRPAALVDLERPDVPGLVGRRLFGPWHLGFGRPALPVAACEVRQAAAVLAWCADRFEEAPPVVNLFDPAMRSRAELLRRFQERGWRGRMIWIPIPLFAALVGAARLAAGLLMRARPAPLALHAILRPRRFDPAVSARVLAAAERPPMAARISPPAGLPVPEGAAR